MFGNRPKRLARRRFRDFVRWMGELSQERREFLMALCYRESQVRDLVSFFSSLSAEQQFDSLTRLGLSTEQAETAMSRYEQSGSERHLGEAIQGDRSFQHGHETMNLEVPAELLEPPRQLKKRIEMNSSVDLS
jgi:hypothetical protein